MFRQKGEQPWRLGAGRSCRLLCYIPENWEVGVPTCQIGTDQFFPTSQVGTPASSDVPLHFPSWRCEISHFPVFRNVGKVRPCKLQVGYDRLPTFLECSIRCLSLSCRKKPAPYEINGCDWPVRFSNR